MTNTPLPPAAQEQLRLEKKIEELGEELDAADIFGVLSTVADHLNLDLVRILSDIKNDEIGSSDHQIITDLLESSQSNFVKAVHNLLEMAIADQAIADL